ncbi:hypothetical protein JCM9279_002784 [Rhodotorula babjevae]
MQLTTFLVAAAALAPLASAHFTLDYPPTRGFDEDIESQFCGGFATPASSRTPFPLSGSAPVTIGSHHASADVAIFLSFDSNPTSFADFNETSSGQSYGPLKPFGQITGTGDYCYTVDIASLGISSLSNGTVATLQVEYNGGDGYLFQCADLVLVSDYSTPSNVSCTNSTESGTSSSSSAAAAASGTGTASASASGTAASGSTGASATGGPSSGAASAKAVVGGLAGALAAVVGAGVMAL